jgi:hypothetical protein
MTTTEAKSGLTTAESRLERRWEQVTAAAAIATVFAFIGELATWGNPHLSDPPAKITDYFVTHQTMALSSIGLGLLGAIALLIFAAGMRAMLSASTTAVLPTVVFGAAVLFASSELTFTSTTGALALVAGEAPRGELRTLLALENMPDLFRFLPIGVLIGAASAAMLGGRDFPRWIAWLGALSSALLLIAEGGILTPADGGGNISDAGMIGLLFFLIWMISTGISLLRRRPASSPSKVIAVAEERLPAQT